MIYPRILTCVLLLTLIALYANAVPPSPAGGRMLRLDETHDFVGTGQAWFPEAEFTGLTVEAWIYMEEIPEPPDLWTIFGQEGRFGLILLGRPLEKANPLSLGVWGYGIGAGSDIGIGGSLFNKNKWVHVAALFDASPGKGVDGKGGNWCCPKGHLIKSDNPFRIGGIVPQDTVNRSHIVGENAKFRGYVDEVRISNIVRYKGPNWKVPRHKFKVDKNTISLWHFDEAPWSGRFKDETENGYDLWRSDAMAVEAQGKLTTTWGQLKK